MPTEQTGPVNGEPTGRERATCDRCGGKGYTHLYDCVNLQGHRGPHPPRCGYVRADR